MPFVAQRQRRLLEAATREGNPDRYWDDFTEEMENGVWTPNDFSIREVFENFVEDGREIVSSWNRGGENGIQLIEAGIETAQFANITGQLMFSAIMDAFNNPMFLSSRLTRTVSTQFDGEKIPGISQIGDQAEDIGEGKPYPRAGLTEEFVETPQTTKRGFIIEVTKEAIFFDRTGVLVQRASDVSQQLAINKEKRVIDAACGVSTLYNRNGRGTVATYGDDSGDHDWDNLQASNGLQDWSDIENAELLFDGLTDPNTGEPIVVIPTAVLVPTALRRTAANIISATEIREVTNTNTTTLSGNPLNVPGGSLSSPLEILSNPWVSIRQGDSTTWWIGDFPGAFWYMENWPITSVAAPANSEMEFTHDVVLRRKVSERGNVAVIEPRKVVESTA